MAIGLVPRSAADEGESSSPSPKECGQEQEGTGDGRRLTRRGTTSASVIASIALAGRARIGGARTGAGVGSFVARNFRIDFRATVDAIANTLALGASVAVGALVAIVALHASAEFILWAKRAGAVADFVDVALVFHTATGFTLRNEIIGAALRYTVAEVRDVAGAGRSATESGVGSSYIFGALKRSTIAIVVLVTNDCRRSAHFGFVMWSPRRSATHL
jgi:hypothetical protein